MDAAKVVMDYNYVTRLRNRNNQAEANPLWLSTREEAFNREDIITSQLDSVLLPLCDAGIDLPSGGSTGEYLPCTFLCSHPDRDLMARMLDLVEAFGAPTAYVVEATAWSTGFDPAAQRRGVAVVAHINRQVIAGLQ